MNFLQKLLQGIALAPAIVQGVEGMFGAKSGADKKNAALNFIQAAIVTTDVIAGKMIVDPAKFQDGLSQLIDGVVACLNASAWTKTKAA